MNNDFEFDSLIKKMASDHQPELPSPGVIWWRAQILKKQAEKERIERPVTIMRVLAALLCLAVVVGLWISQAVGISSILNRAGGFPFSSFLVAGVLIGIGCIGLMWWKASEA
ncbi:MAG: hypothetical protein ACXV5J_09455 [Candidatus Angelobacter sp.]